MTRQSGSHMRLTTEVNGTHNITVPDHSSLRIGTLSAIVLDVASHLGLERQDVIKRLFS
jgi:predicted RNA binding protein YcfA (HicA-like mRNA interferase family)